MNKDLIVIKKYSNRRLYNTEESKYVKVDEIAQLIRDGFDIKVIDTTTREDITKQILAQIIMEEEKNKKDILPTSLFYKIIRSNQMFVRDFFENYFLQTMDAYLSYRQAMEEKLKEMQDVSRLPMEMGDLFMKNMWMMGTGNYPFDKKDKNK